LAVWFEAGQDAETALYLGKHLGALGVGEDQVPGGVADQRPAELPADQVPEPEADTTAAVPALAPGPSPEPPVADVTPSPETEPEPDAASGSESDERPPPAASSGTSPHTT